MFIEDSGQVAGHVLQNDIGGINLLSAEGNSTAVRLSLRRPQTPAGRIQSPPGRDTEMLTGFAEEYRSTHGKVEESFEPPPAVLEDFRVGMERNHVRVPEEFWSKDQDYLKLCLKVDLPKLVFSLTCGDELETKGDPQAPKTASLFPQISHLLKRHCSLHSAALSNVIPAQAGIPVFVASRFRGGDRG
jgi:hypothetical protein